MNKPTKGEKAKIRQLIRSIYGKGRKIAKSTELQQVYKEGKF